MRGEHSSTPPVELNGGGSSPLARGAPNKTYSAPFADGIIPACAGSTGGSTRAARDSWDHPRLRGEHTSEVAPGVTTTGSSPLARGALVRRRVQATHAGIIPACAGSTQGAHRRAGQGGDHPRLRGEHMLTKASLSSVVGSSPLARGARQGKRRALWRGGIIPACAGSTRGRSPRRAAGGDHPRLRGEHMRAERRPQRHQGSSPLARGALALVGERHAVLGIIPACAGSTRCWPSSTPSTRDHPRLRGEHTLAERYRLYRRGSSPLARGAPA